jgi:Sec-independent protein translocase protein TatA
MDFLGVGPLEFFFILLIALVIFGPNDIVKAAKTLGSFMRKIVLSDSWRTLQHASKEIKNLPTTLMREAGLEETDLQQLTGITDMKNVTRDLNRQIASAWTTPPQPRLTDNPGNAAGVPNPQEIAQPAADEENIIVDTPASPPDSPFSQTIDKD